MKKIFTTMVLLTTLSVGLFSLNGVVDAQGTGSEVGITITEDYVPPEPKPVPKPTPKPTPQPSPKPVAKPAGQTWKKYLPQTGEGRMYLLLFIGLILITIVGTYYIMKKRSSKKRRRRVYR